MELQDKSTESITDDEFETELSALGKEQATALATRLKDVPFDHVYSSDLRRARSTAEYLAQDRGLPVITSSEIREVHYGKHHHTYYQVKPMVIQEVKKLPEEEKMKFQLDDMETEEHGVNRLLGFVKKVAQKDAGKTVAIVCHGKIIRLFLIKVGYGKYDELQSGSIQNTGYCVVEGDGEEFVVKETWGITKG